jgi:hypothetical protein
MATVGEKRWAERERLGFLLKKNKRQGRVYKIILFNKSMDDMMHDA